MSDRSLSTCYASYNDFSTASSVTLTTANTAVAFTGYTVSDVQGPGAFATGVYTVAKGGKYVLDVDCTFGATQADPALQQCEVLVNGAVHRGMSRTRDEALGATKTRVSFGGMTDYLSAGSTISLAFVSDTASDTAEVFECSIMIERVHEILGTAV